MFPEQMKALLSAAGIGDVEVLECLAAWRTIHLAPKPQGKGLKHGDLTT